jgi:nitroimidazol reductase NimA-like FMN-containing flavoprotein (pyridoxamine 5'-phosphate oxidase superfamily)
MLDAMKELIKQQDLCVLATHTGERPYCSLMAYVANDEASELYLATHRSTRKFRNLSDHPEVSVLIDTRTTEPRSTMRALTIEGRCSPIEDEVTQQAVRTQLLAKHPHLTDFVVHDDCALLCVTIRSLLLLNGLNEAHYATLA